MLISVAKMVWSLQEPYDAHKIQNTHVVADFLL